MKVLIVDDSDVFVPQVVKVLRQAGLEADGIIASWSMMTEEGEELADDAALKLVRNADVIFLDHRMPGRDGEQLYRDWQTAGVDLSTKRVIGTSSYDQPYLQEQCSAGVLTAAASVKNLLGIE